MDLMSATLLSEDTGVPFDQLQAEQIARFGKSYTGEPDVLAEELAKDAAVRDADTLLLTVPDMLGVDHDARLLETIARHVAPAIGWAPRGGQAAS